jgi:hypothetical protein
LEESEAIVINVLGVVITASLIIMAWLLRTNPVKRGITVVSERL